MKYNCKKSFGQNDERIKSSRLKVIFSSFFLCQPLGSNILPDFLVVGLYLLISLFLDISLVLVPICALSLQLASFFSTFFFSTTAIDGANYLLSLFSHLAKTIKSQPQLVMFKVDNNQHPLLQLTVSFFETPLDWPSHFFSVTRPLISLLAASCSQTMPLSQPPFIPLGQP